MKDKKLKYWIIGFLLVLSVLNLRYSNLIGFNFKGFDIGTQKIIIILGYIVLIPTIILILSYKEKIDK